MASYGKKRTRGPISKGYFGKLDSVEKGYNEAAKNYKEGVSAHKDDWYKGVAKYLSYYVPRIEEFVRTPEFKSKSSEDRFRSAIFKTSEIAAEYDMKKEDEMRKAIIEAYRNLSSASLSSQSGFGVYVSGKEKVLIL